jgi:hypothetical protein
MMITFVGQVEPFKSKTSNTIDLVNEAFIVLKFYHLVCFTDFVIDKTVQSYVGYSLISIMCLNICVDLGVIILQNFPLAVRKVKIEWFKSK